MRRRAAIVPGLIAAAVLLSGCAGLGEADGDALARDRLREIGAEIAEDLSHPQIPHSAEHVAARIAERDFANAEVVPLSWDGDVASPPDTGEPDAVVIRVDVAIEAYSPPYVGERGHSAGTASGCLAYELRLNRETEARDVDCPGVVPDHTPELDPSFPEDTVARVDNAMRAADAGTLDGLMHAAFPEPHVLVDSGVVAGEPVVALGVPVYGDCRVFVRHADASVEQVSFDPSSALPGELGCSVWLYGRPDS